MKILIKFFIGLIFFVLLILFFYYKNDTQATNQNNQDQNVAIQGFWFDLGVDLAIGVATTQGASLANAQITAERQMLSTKVAKNSQTIQTSLSAFQSSAQEKQTEKITSISNSFSQAQKNIQNDLSQTLDDSQKELSYLYQNISTEKPQQNYIFSAIEYDQIFSNGIMKTPAGALWRNPFSVGDWKYEKSTNSFWQNESSPIFSLDQANQNTSIRAENNAIYAEYHTKEKSYTISGSITFHQVDFPFFAGIIFNKYRWISGDFESVRKCRMVGIYGASTDNINIYFAQQYTMTNEQIKALNSQDPIQTPLKQIIANAVPEKIKLPNSIFNSLKTNPVVIDFTIQNSPDKVTIQFKLPSGSLPSFTIDKLDPSIFMYHGIGFISPSAICQFKLTSPADFIFTQDAINNYLE